MVPHMLDPKNMVRKSNDVVEACYAMDTPELRLIYSCISQIDFKQTIDKDDLFEIRATEYAKLFNLDVSNAHKELQKSVNKLWNREITIQRKGKPPLETRWISAKANWGDGIAEVRFAPDVIPYLTSLLEMGNFTIYQIENIGDLKNAYSIRLYELLKQYQLIGSRCLTVVEIRERLGIGNKHKRMTDFKKWVIDLAVTEINEHTDIKVSYTQEKIRQRIESFSFTIKEKHKSLPKKPGKKYLSKGEVEAMAKIGDSWDVTYSKLAKEGYTFKREAYV